MKETIAKWDVAGSGPLRELHISPTGNTPAYRVLGEEHAREVLRHVKSPLRKTILDFGCGDGRVTIPLAKRFKHVVAVDGSSTMLKAMPVVENITQVLYTGDGIDIGYSKVDVVYSTSVFIHNTYQDGCKILMDLSAVTVQGGLLLMHIPLYDEARAPENWTDVGVWTLNMLCNAADQAGLRLESWLTNQGAFSFNQVGPNHGALQVLRKI